MFSPKGMDLERGWPGRIEGDRVIQLAAQTRRTRCLNLRGWHAGDSRLAVAAARARRAEAACVVAVRALVVDACVLNAVRSRQNAGHVDGAVKLGLL